MDGFSILDPLVWDPAAIKLHPAYAVGNAAGYLSKTGAAVGVNHYLSGRLHLSKSGWLLLSVPNALVRGVFDAMTATGAELPTMSAFKGEAADKELLNAHITVMTGEEVEKIGPDKINERGHHFHYALGPVREFTPKTETISRVWAIQVASPELAALRKSYGLSALPNGDHPFHITVAVRRKNVLGANEIAKVDGSRGALKAAAEKVPDVLPGGEADHKPDSNFPQEALAEGKQHEREHTDNAEIAEEIAKDHLSEDPAYYKKVEQIEKGAGSVYLDQGRQLLDPLAIQKPIPYDHSKPVFENIKSQLTEAKRRGDFIRDSDRNHKMWRAQLDPRYRHQLALKAIRGQTERPNLIDQVIARYGDDVLAQFPTGKK
jgi:hypothetical protein